MATDSDEEHIDDEQQNEFLFKDKERRIFFNHLDCFHGKNIARVFARVKPGVTGETANEEEAVEEEMSEGKTKNFYDDQPIDQGWKVFGTVKNLETYKRAPFVQQIVQNQNRNELFEFLKGMNVIVYDITDDPQQIDEAMWICQKFEPIIAQLDHQITFILLSSIMTWDKTTPNDDDVPFSEDEFRRRKAHPNFKEHYAIEKFVTKIGLTDKKKLLTYVVAAGLTYGMGEQVFHHAFKASWHNIVELPVYGKGINFLPTIHVIDLASILQNLADRQLKTRYVIATDTSKDTLLKITRKISQTLGNGRIRVVEQEDAMLNRDISQTDYDMLAVNLQFEPLFIKENMSIKWHCENGLSENIQKVVDEYRVQRNLTPIRICILGPPASGKTTVAKQLAEEYKLHHLQIRDVIEDTKNDLEQLIKRSEQQNNEEEMEEEEIDEALAERVDEARNILERLKEIREESKDGRLDDDMVIQLYKWKLMSSPCQNQGYVLDGFPKTLDQASSLFSASGDEEEESTTITGDDKKPPVNERLHPDFVFVLEASNEFLRQRIMHLPEKLVSGTHNVELEFKRRLKTYNDLADDSPVVKFFEDVDRPADILKIDDDRSPNHRKIVEKIMEKIQKPHNYGPTPEEQEEVKRKQLAEREKHDREEREERERDEQEASIDRMKKQKEWALKLEQIKRDELQQLDTQSAPLRNYLMTHVMPTLTKALIECCRVRPDDPVDFVAEYLFKNNPQV